MRAALVVAVGVACIGCIEAHTSLDEPPARPSPVLATSAPAAADPPPARTTTTTAVIAAQSDDLRRACDADRAQRAETHAAFQRAAEAAVAEEKRQRQEADEANRARAEREARRETLTKYIEAHCKQLDRPVERPALCVDSNDFVRLCSEVVDVATYWKCPENGPLGARGLIGGGYVSPSNTDPRRVARLARHDPPEPPALAEFKRIRREVDAVTDRDAQCAAYDGDGGQRSEAR